MLNILTSLILAWLSLSRPELARGERYSAHATVITDHAANVELRGPAWLSIEQPTRAISESTTLAYTVRVADGAPFDQLDFLTVWSEGREVARLPVRSAAVWPRRVWLPLVVRGSPAD